ncbi:condensation domain-containing protein [Pendulispora albinea]|uniref:Condensation domain-containing protein n=1 Tax=Pendulispora albinea TaxID=2741071 RepID=A0ABZ2MAH9_9BACT
MNPLGNPHLEARADAETEDEPAPLGFAQQYLWFLLQYPDSGPARFNGNLAFEITGPLDVDRLGKALALLEERHEPLRTCLRLVKGQPRQIVEKPRTGTLIATDLSSLPDAARALALDDAIRSEVELPLDFVRGPVHRTRLLRLGAEHHVLLWTTNHVNVDFWSYRNFIGELRALYTALIEEDTPARPVLQHLPPLPVRFAEVARAQRARIAPDDRRVAFWRTYLEGATCYQPPHRQPRSTRPSPEQTRWVRVEKELAERVARSSRALGCTRFSMVLAALALVAQRWSGATDIVTLVASAHRTTQTKSLIGSFADMLPVRVRLLPGVQTRSDVVRATQSSIRRALIHELPLRRIEEATGQTYRFTFGITDHVPFYDCEGQAPDHPRAMLSARWPDAAEIACKPLIAPPLATSGSPGSANRSGRAGTLESAFLRVFAFPMRMYRMDLLFAVERDLLLCTYQPDLFTAETIDYALGWLLEALDEISAESR